MQKDYFKHRIELAEAMKNSMNEILEISNEFYKISGRKYDLFEKYMLDDADLGIVVLNSTAGTTKDVIDNLRKNNIKAGLLKPRTFRPFPAQDIASELKHLKAIAVLDKSDSVNGYSGPLFSEITSALYTSGANVPAINYIYGLGGTDIKFDDIEKVFTKLDKISKGEKFDVKNYLGIDYDKKEVE